MSANALEARGLAKRYRTVEAVSSLDLTVRRGEIYGFLGPNGAGKTTTILMLLGVEKPSAGSINVLGEPAPLDPFFVKTRIGVVSETQYLYDDMSAWEYLTFFGRLNRVENAAARAQALLERVGLWEFRRLRARDHSRGMQQKLGLVRALLHEPELLVLDEPVSGLDPHGIRQVREILLEQNRRGVTIFISSHILSEVERTAHRVGILHGGRLVAEDTVDAIGARLGRGNVIELHVEEMKSGLVAALERLSFVRSVERSSNGSPTSGKLRVVVDEGDRRRDLSAMITSHGGLITQMQQQRISLEEAFVRLTTDTVRPLLPRDAAEPARGDQ